MGFDAWEDNGATLGRSWFNKPDSEIGTWVAGFEKRGVRDMGGN
jgi:hypothetical protein